MQVSGLMLGQKSTMLSVQVGDIHLCIKLPRSVKTVAHKFIAVM